MKCIIAGDIVWKSTRGHTPIDFFGIPFKVVANIQYECSYGQQRYKSTSTDFEVKRTTERFNLSLLFQPSLQLHDKL